MRDMSTGVLSVIRHFENYSYADDSDSFVVDSGDGKGKGTNSTSCSTCTNHSRNIVPKKNIVQMKVHMHTILNMHRCAQVCKYAQNIGVKSLIMSLTVPDTAYEVN